MSSFTFIPRAVKKKATPSVKLSNASQPSAPGAHQREVSFTNPVTQISALAFSRSEDVVTTEWNGDAGGNQIELKGKSREQNQPTSAHPEHDARQEGAARNTNTVKPTKAPDLKDLAGLVCLSLSDYQLWTDVELRQKIDWGSEDTADHDDMDGSNQLSDENRGYVPLDYLVHHSTVFLQANAAQPETLFVKAIRTHAAELLDVRLVLASEETNHGSKWQKKSQVETGYQVRRRIPPPNRSKSQWDNLTIYLENIPAHLRSLLGVFKLVSNLLPQTIAVSPSRVQAVIFPPHHRDRPGSIPNCKGFALVVLSQSDDVEYMLNAYSWDVEHGSVPTTQTSSSGQKDPEEVSDIKRDAGRFGLRVLRKSRWDELKAEYLLYRQQLIEEINHHQESKVSHTVSKPHAKENPPKALLVRKEADTLKPGPSPKPPQENFQSHSTEIHANSSFPSGCLVFVRNVNTETNKTTLRALFSQVAKGGDGQNDSQLAGDGIDYVDYMKGMDNCHLRLSTPAHAERLLSYFTKHSTVQTTGLDGVGKKLSDATEGTTILPELVLGKREQVYWEKVPEKVRRQAVDKALKIMRGSNDATEEAADDSGRKQKKRRRG